MPHFPSSFSTSNMLNYTAGGKTTAATDSHKTGIFKKVQYCKSAPNNYLIIRLNYACNLFIKTLTIMWTLRVWSARCHMVPWPAGWCICMPVPASLCIWDEEFEWHYVLLHAIQFLSFFYLKVCESLLSSLTSWIYLFHSLLPRLSKLLSLPDHRLQH